MVLLPGDKLVLYTDGVTEATNAAYDMYEEKRLTEVLEKSADADVEQTVHAVSRSIDAFVDGAEQADDITMVILKWNPGAENAAAGAKTFPAVP